MHTILTLNFLTDPTKWNQISMFLVLSVTRESMCMKYKFVISWWFLQTIKQNVGPDLDQYCLTLLQCSWKNFLKKKIEKKI